MTEKKTLSEAEQFLKDEEALQEKLAMKMFIARKQMNRKDYRDAVEALDMPQDEWGQFEILISTAYKTDPSKGWDYYLDASQEDLEKVILSK